MNLLSSIIMVAMAACVVAWTSNTTAAQTPARDQVGSPGDANMADCMNVPGGNAPISRIARLEGGLSVRSLNLTYYGKTLDQLTDRDWRYLEELWPLCGTYEKDVAAVLATQARKVINESKAVQAATRDWMRATKARVDGLSASHEDIIVIHNLWQEMLNRELDMTVAEFADMTEFMKKSQQRVYESGDQEQRILVRPFDPGPTDVRDPYK
jgi:hypothetical protein